MSVSPVNQDHVTATENTTKSRPFLEGVVKNLEFTSDGGSLCHDFVCGSLAMQILEGDVSEETKIEYYQQCLRTLDWSFTDNLIKGNLLPIYTAAIEEMSTFIKNSLNSGVTDQEIMREKLPLDTAPFKYAKKVHLNIQEMTKDDEIRVAFQALFLFVLRPFIPLKYQTMESFLEKYVEFKERNATEQDRLRNTANWMDLAFYTIQPRNNKTFILNLIPRIVEGKNARYITGSGQTRPTADRVHLFRTEGNCEKIKRPPRRKKEEILMAKLTSENRTSDVAKSDSETDNKQPTRENMISKYYEPHNNATQGHYPPYYVPYYNPGMIPSKDLEKFKAWQQYNRQVDPRISNYRELSSDSSGEQQSNSKLTDSYWYGNSIAPNAFYNEYMQRDGLGYPYDYERMRMSSSYPVALQSSSAQHERGNSSMPNYFLNQYPNNYSHTSHQPHLMSNFAYHSNPQLYYNRFDPNTSTDSDSPENLVAPSKRRRNSSPQPNENNSNNNPANGVVKPSLNMLTLNDGGLDMLLAAAGSMDGQKG